LLGHSTDGALKTLAYLTFWWGTLLGHVIGGASKTLASLKINQGTKTSLNTLPMGHLARSCY
jgi:hypothetical protein